MSIWIRLTVLWLTRAVLSVVVAFSALVLWNLFKSPNSALDRSVIASLVLVGFAALLASFSANPWLRKYRAIGAVLTMVYLALLVFGGVLPLIMTDI
jgi:hypothetical protein